MGSRPLVDGLAEAGMLAPGPGVARCLCAGRPTHPPTHRTPPCPTPPLQEYRDTTLNGAVEQMYQEMGSRHRVRSPCIQIIKTATITAAQVGAAPPSPAAQLPAA